VNKATLFCLAAAITAGAAVFTGCGSDGDGDGDGGGTSGDCFDYSTFDGSEPETTLRADVLPVFQTSCGIAGGTCHGIANNSLPGQAYLGEALGTTMTDEQIAEVLEQNVNVASVKGGTMRLIVPNDPENSFLMAKVDGLCGDIQCTDGDCGDAMPQTGGPLKSENKEKIRRWIAQGAQDN
jgi:hypothetical protein